MEPFSIIVPVYRREEKAEELLERLKQRPPEGLENVVSVVDEGSLDIEWGMLQVLENRQRVGKSRAINQALEEIDTEINVLLSSDVEVGAETIERMVEVVEAGTDLAVPRVQPADKNSVASRVFRTIWKLNHHLSLERPKMGEVMAFRDNIEIPEEVAVDEEYIASQKDSARYLPGEEAVNQSPISLKQLYIQRRRIFVGHLDLQRRENYVAPTNQPVLLLKAIRSYLSSGEELAPLLQAAVIEWFARSEGFLRALSFKIPWMWTTVETY
ncbi:MAG: glycosyltransferase family 2 protein [Candidatus Nanohaloarchaea archaeon]